MRQLLIFIGLFLITFTSCKKDSSKISVSGIYTEASPVNGRSQLNFISTNLVIKTEPGGSSRDTFKYSFTSNQILLTPNGTTQYPVQQFDFEKIDETTIKIQNLYPGIPEGPKTFMIFKK